MLMIINKGSSLTIVNETTNFIQTVVYKKKLYETLSNVVLYEGKKFVIFFKTAQLKKYGCPSGRFSLSSSIR